MGALGEEQAVIVGHDWGAPVAWNAAMWRPDIFRAVIGMSVPAIDRPRRAPTATMKQAFGDNFFYMLYFQTPGVAEHELQKDVRRSLRMLLYSASGAGAESAFLRLPKTAGFLDQLMDPEKLPDWLTEDDLDYFTNEFLRTGFRGGLNWYRNLDRTWELSAPFAGKCIEQPALFITGDRDLTRGMPGFEERMRTVVSNLREVVTFPGVGHWTQQENPEGHQRRDAGIPGLAGLTKGHENVKPRVTGMEVLPVAVSERTRWLFVRLSTNVGVSGLGEASAGDPELPELEEFYGLLGESLSIQAYRQAGLPRAAAGGGSSGRSVRRHRTGALGYPRQAPGSAGTRTPGRSATRRGATLCQRQPHDQEPRAGGLRGERGTCPRSGIPSRQGGAFRRFSIATSTARSHRSCDNRGHRRHAGNPPSCRRGRGREGRTATALSTSLARCRSPNDCDPRVWTGSKSRCPSMTWKEWRRCATSSSSAWREVSAGSACKASSPSSRRAPWTS